MDGLKFPAAFGIAVCSAVLCLYGADGWGWFLFIALLVAMA